MGFKRILIAVDGSPIAAHAADIGIALASCLKAEVAFIHVVVDTSNALGSLKLETAIDKPATIAEQEGRNLLGAFRERAGTSPPALEFLETGRPAVKIVESARCWPADVIVIASHGRGRIQRLLLGSVAESVVRHAPCPVLVVRAQT